MAQIKSLQILRAGAALAVAFGHFEHEASTMASAHRVHPVLLDLTGAGVDLFFIISGFVMVYASRDLFATPGGSRIFILHRLARIVPMYWALTTLFLVLQAFGPRLLASPAPSALEILGSYMFVPVGHLGAGVVQPVYKLGWTLNYEMLFYVVFAALIPLSRRAAVAGVTLAFLALAILGRAVALPAGALAVWTDPIILEFVMGAILANAYLEGLRIAPGPGLALLGSGGLGFALATLGGLDTHGVWRPLIWGLPALCIVAGGVTLSERLPDTSFVRRLVLWGDASYAIYLLHPMVIRAMRLVWDKGHLAALATPWLFVGLGLAIVVPVSLLVHRGIERPLTRWLARTMVGDARRGRQHAAVSSRTTA